MMVKRTGRATKIERLPDEQQVFVIGRIDARIPAGKISAEFEEKFKQPLAESTIYSYIRRRWLPTKIEAERTVAEAKEFINLRKSNPDIPEDVLLRGFLRQRQASRGFQEGPLDPKIVIFAELQMRKLDIAEQRIKAEEKRQGLKQRELEWKLEQIEKQRRKEREQLTEAVVDGEKDPTRTLERIKEIYNLPA